MSPRGPFAFALMFCVIVSGCVSGVDERERDVDRARERTGTLSREGDPLEALLRAGPRAPESDPRVDELLRTAPTLAGVEDAAVRRNPGLKAALERWVAFLERPAQRSVPAYPTFNEHYAGMFKMLEFGAGFMLPYPGKLLDEARAALADADAAGADFRAAEDSLRARAAMEYATLSFARREVVVVDENLALLERFVSVAQARYRAGTGSLPDVLRVETERESLLTEREVLGHNVEIAQSALNVLLDRAPDEVIGPLAALEEPAPSGELAALSTRALARRPELAAARARAASSDFWRDRASDEWLPDLSVGAAYTRDFGMGRNFADLTAGVSLPWFFAPAISARVREADALHRGAEAEARSMRNTVLDEVRSGFARVEAARAKWRRLTAEVIPRIRKNVEASEAAYVAGQVDFLTLIDTQRSLLQALLERESSLAELTTRQAELERAIGGARADEAH